MAVTSDGKSFDFVVCSQCRTPPLPETTKAISLVSLMRLKAFSTCPGQVIKSRDPERKEREPRSAVREDYLPPPTEARKRWHGSSFGASGSVPLKCIGLSASSPLLLSPAQNSGKSSRNFLSLNNGASFVSQCTISELFSCLYFPSLRTGTILLYSLLYLPKFFQRSKAKYVLIK